MEYTILILLLPLLSFLFLGLAGMKLKPAAAGLVGTAVLGVVTLLSCCTAFEYFTAGRDAAGAFPTLIPWNTVWLPISRTLHIDMGILLDPISVMMLVVISTVSLMVHVYSLGYMKGERGFQRYYAFLSLFTMSMMGLVVATNIFQMYLFWELVGVSSYLLIGFYYTKKEAVAASKKAFIVTRFADLGFLVGILFYGYYAGTFSFTPEVRLLAAAGTMIPLALGLMFIGGSPAGTAGGVKTVTILLLFASMFANIRGKSNVTVMHRKIPDDTIRRCVAIVTFSFSTLLVLTTALLAVQQAGFLDALYEMTSAIATVGLSRGLTGALLSPGKLLIILTMYLGRIGPITLALAFNSRGPSENAVPAEGKVIIG